MSYLAKIKYIKCERGYWYYRRKGSPRSPLRGKPGEANFMVDYALAHAAYEKPDAPRQSADTVIIDRSFRWLAVKYFATEKFKSLRTATKRNYRHHAELAMKAIGHRDVNSVTMADALEIRDFFEQTPDKAESIMKSLRVIYGWGMPRGYAKMNPADFRGTDVERLKGGSWLPWPEEMLVEAMAGFSDPVRRVVLTCLYTGQRIGDVLKIKHKDILEDGTIYVKQQKTGKELFIPVHPDLQIMLDTMDVTSTDYLLTSVRGRQWSYTGLNQAFRTDRKRLGLDPQYKVHGFRKNAVIRLLLCGCTTQETGAITGQTDETVSYYAKGINQRKLAIKAMARYATWTSPERAMNGNGTVEQVSFPKKVVKSKSGES